MIFFIFFSITVYKALSEVSANVKVVYIFASLCGDLFFQVLG